MNDRKTKQTPRIINKQNPQIKSSESVLAGILYNCKKRFVYFFPIRKKIVFALTNIKNQLFMQSSRLFWYYLYYTQNNCVAFCVQDCILRWSILLIIYKYFMSGFLLILQLCSSDLLNCLGISRSRIILSYSFCNCKKQN